MSEKIILKFFTLHDDVAADAQLWKHMTSIFGVNYD
jgi:hypothetical protein